MSRNFKISKVALEKLLKAQAQEKPDVTPKQRFVKLKNHKCAPVTILSLTFFIGRRMDNFS